MSLGPGKLVGFRNNRTEGDPDPRTILASGARRFGVNAIDLLLGLRQRLAP